MKDSTKIFIASLIIFACSIGFFLGAFSFGSGNALCPSKAVSCCAKQLDCCKKNMDCCKKKGPCGPDCTCPKCKRHGEEFGEGPHHKGDHFRDDFRKDKKFDKKFKMAKDIEFMDSVLQVTHEQKAALIKQRNTTDSIFKILRKQKKEAEKALREALDANDDKKIAAAKASILKAQEGLLNNRIDGVQGLNKILTKEQLEKFKSLQVERMKHEKRGDHKDHDKEPPRD